MSEAWPKAYHNTSQRQPLPEAKVACTRAPVHETELSRTVLEVIPRAMASIRAEMRGLARPEFTVVHFRVLAQLSSGPRTASELAENIGVGLPAVSRLVDALSRKG